MAWLVFVTLFGALTLYSGEGPTAGHAPSVERWGLGLSIIGRLLTIPLDTPAPSDIRTLLFPTLCAAAIMWFALRHSTSAANGHPVPAPVPRTLGRANVAALAMLAMAGLCACLSAQTNGTWDYSAGWMIGLATGIAWAALLCVATPAPRVRQMLMWALIAGGAAMLLALWHRQQMGLRYFTWPVGALTPTAGTAALLAATVVGGMVARLIVATRGSNTSESQPAPKTEASRKHRIRAWIVAAAVGLAAVAVLWLAGRRSPLLGAAAGVMLAAFAGMIARGVRRGAMAVAIGAAIGLIALAGIWVRGQALAERVEVSGPVSLRMAYLRESLSLIGASPLIGHGPDSFAPVVTPRFALRRAESPQVYHGDIDPHAHNEWLQAAVELGIPGGLAYLAAPCIAIIAGVLGVRRHAPGLRPPANAHITGQAQPCTLVAVRIALAAGLACIIVSELASTSLRGPILTPWYWTWLGLLMALNKPQSSEPARAAASAPRARLVRICLTGLAVALLALVAAEWQRMRAHAQANRAMQAGQPPEWIEQTLRAARDRWGFSAWWTVECDLAQAALAVAETSMPDDSASRQSALQQWLPLKARFGNMRGVRVQCARAMILMGDTHTACKELATSLALVDPYDALANTLLVTYAIKPPSERLNALAAALRSSALTPDIESLAAQAWAEPGALANWIDQLSRDERGDNSGAQDAATSLRPERLRLEAARRAKSGDAAGAIACQQAAADQYRKWFEGDAAHRRGHAAEWDAWYRLAEVYWRQPRRDPRLALQAVRWAERFAVMGCAHEHRRGAAEQDEYLGGQVVLTASPLELQPLFRLSAAIRLALGHTDSHTQYRLLLALPIERQTMQEAAQLREALLRN